MSATAGNEAVIPDSNPDAVRADHLRRVYRVLQHVHAHLSEPLDLPTLGRVAHLSPQHLTVVFRGIVGETVYQHVKRLRLERAAYFLRFTAEPVAGVALACGFDAPEAFSRAFAAAFGSPPRAFRERWQPTTELPAPSGLHYQPEGVPADFRPAPDLGRTLAVSLVQLPAIRLACARYRGPYTHAHRAWPRLLWWAWRNRQLDQHAELYGLCYDDETITPPEKQRYDAAVRVEESFAGDGDIVAHTVPAGQFARCVVTGTFADYWRASEAFCSQWLPASGLALRAMFTLDRYHLPPRTLNPIRLLSEVSNRFHVEMHLPVGPGPFERSVLS